MSEVTKEQYETLAAAKIVAIGHWPYIADALFSMQPVPSPKLNTFASDTRWRLYYDPEWMMQHTVQEIAGLLLHEVSHCLRGHGERFARMNEPHSRAPLMNIAGDSLINEDLNRSNVKLPDGGVYLSTIAEHYGVTATADMSTEEIYRLIADTEPPCTCSNSSDDSSDGSSGDDSSDGSSGDDSSDGSSGDDSSGDDSDSSGSQQTCTHCQPQNECGSGAHGVPREFERSADDAEFPGVGEDQAENTRQKTAKAIQQHAKNQGNVPAGWDRWASERLTPVVDWRKELASRVRRHVTYLKGRADYSFLSQNRRNPALRNYGHPIVMPGMKEPEPPRVAVVIDTSGSMSETELCWAITETHGVLLSLGGASRDIVLVSCDADATVNRHVRSIGGNTALTGGGGTDMRIGITAAVDEKPSPEIVIVLTDGYTPWPDEPIPNVHLIVGLTTPNAQDSVPDWATTVIISQSAEAA